MLSKFTIIIISLLILFVIIGFYLNEVYLPSQPYYLSINVFTNNTTYYIYQMVNFHIKVNNYGNKAIKGLYLGVYENDNLTELYNITLPPHTNTSFTFNASLQNPGLYRFEFIVDPQHLFNIANRTNVSKIINISALSLEKPNPYAIIKPHYYFVEGGTLNSFALSTLYDLNKSYGIFFNVSYMPPLEKAIEGVIFIALPYIRNISFATALYNTSNNSIISSIWISGFIKKDLLDSVFSGLGYKIKNMSSYSFVKEGNVTICYNYSGGWIKIIGVENGNCTSIKPVNNITFNANGPKLKLNNTVYLGSYFYSNYSHSSIYSINSSIDIITNTTYLGNLLCYGLVSKVNNKSYCSTYLLPLNKSLTTPIRVVETKVINNKFNYSVISLFNASLNIFEKVNESIGILSSLYHGPSLNFISALSNYCYLSNALNCSNLNYSNSTVTFKIRNELNKEIHIKSISCFINPPYNASIINKTLEANQSMILSTKCFNNGSTIEGLPFGLLLKIMLSYSYNNSNATTIGEAFIV